MLFSSSSASSYSNTSSLFRDDGFEDDFVSTASDKTSTYQSSASSTRASQQSNHRLSFQGRHHLLRRSYHQYNSASPSSSSPRGPLLPPPNKPLNLATKNNEPGYLDSNLSISQRVVTEIIETERTYVDDLEQIVTGYICFLRNVLKQQKQQQSQLQIGSKASHNTASTSKQQQQQHQINIQRTATPTSQTTNDSGVLVNEMSALDFDSKSLVAFDDDLTSATHVIDDDDEEDEDDQDDDDEDQDPDDQDVVREGEDDGDDEEEEDENQDNEGDNDNDGGEEEKHRNVGGESAELVANSSILIVDESDNIEPNNTETTITKNTNTTETTTAATNYLQDYDHLLHHHHHHHPIHSRFSEPSIATEKSIENEVESSTGQSEVNDCQRSSQTKQQIEERNNLLRIKQIERQQMLRYNSITKPKHLKQQQLEQQQHHQTHENDNNNCLNEDGAIMTANHIEKLFSNLEEIYKFNKDLLFRLEECYLDPSSVAECFVENSAGFDVYTHYCTSYPIVVSTLTELMANPTSAQLLKERQEKLGQSLPLGAYLLKPVQRILKYHILFQSLITHTENEEIIEKDRLVIKEAFSVMSNIAGHINSMKRRHEHAIRVQEVQGLLTGWRGPDLTTLGELILEDSFKLFDRPKSLRHLFLFDNVLLITKKKRDGSLAYKVHIECPNLMLIENIKGQPLVFETVPFDNPKALCAFQARNLDKKRDWCLQMKEVIIKSFDNRIPRHVRDLLMSLTTKSTSDSDLNKETTSDSVTRTVKAPNYLERKNKSKQDKKK